MDDLICIQPTIIRWTSTEHEEVVVAHIRGDSDEETALFVFRSEADAEGFSSAHPRFSEADGFTVEAVDLYELARIVEAPRFPNIVLVMSWSEKDVKPFSSWSFLEMLGNLPVVPRRA